MYPRWLPEALMPVVARLARVDDFLGEMADLSMQWSFNEPIELQQFVRSDGRVRTIVAAVRPIPPAISMFFSEAIHHLRAVLDNAIWHLVTEQMSTIDDKAARAVAMPIHPDVEHFERWARNTRNQVPILGQATESVHQRVLALQPFADKSRILSMSPALAAVLGVEPESAHPLLLLQGYSNLDKHRAISLMVGRTTTTSSNQPLLAQDRSFQEFEPGTVLGPDRTWGDPVEFEANTAVMVQRPNPWHAAVSPATETEQLRDWVRHIALPLLVTGSPEVPPPMPEALELGDDGSTLRERISTSSRPSALARTAAKRSQLFAEATSRPLRFPTVVKQEFD